MEKVLYTAVEAWRLNATSTDRQSAQQGSPGSILGPVTLAWWAHRRGGGARPGLVVPRHPGGSLA